LGVFLRPIEERIFDSIAELYRHPTVMKGMNSSRSGRIMFEKWNAFKNPVAVGLDASRFDQHVSRVALQWEHDIYLQCFPRRQHRRRLKWLLRMQLNNQCSGYTEDGMLRYHTDGVRMSGDMNTSLGNCVLMCCLVMAYARSKGVFVHLANNGDDCVVFLEMTDLPTFMEGLSEWFLGMGFNMAVEEPCTQFESIEFCQTHPVYVGPLPHDYLMVRHPKWAIAKDTICVHNYLKEKEFRGWLHAVGTRGLAMNGGIPIFQSFYSCYLRFGVFVKWIDAAQSWGVRALERGMRRQAQTITPATRASFYWAFGITPDEQLCIERFYEGVTWSAVPELVEQYRPPMPS